jgi:hypothetical protein
MERLVEQQGSSRAKSDVRVFQGLRHDLLICVEHDYEWTHQGNRIRFVVISIILPYFRNPPSALDENTA